MAIAVTFDVDGTIIDSMGLHLEAWSVAFSRYGFEVTAVELQTQFGRRADLFVKHFVPDAAEDEVRSIVEDKREYYRRRIGTTTIIPGARDLLSALKRRNCRVAFATSASRKELNFYIEHLRLKELIDADISGDEILHSKPDPEILVTLLERLQIPANQAVYVGDSPHDMSAAAEIGVTGVGVLTGGYSENLLKERGAAAVFESVAGISPDFLLSLGA